VNIEIPGLMIGHWTDEDALTGATVVLLPDGTVASGEVRGGAPATREFALLDPQCIVDRVDAVVLSGGSAFGLAAADGVVTELEMAGRGFPTDFGPVPIVVGMSLFDLGAGSSDVRPGPSEGRRAYRSASQRPAVGRVGAGTGATVGKWRGPEWARRGGLGIATVHRAAATVVAVVAVNSAGDVGPPVGADQIPEWPSDEAGSPLAAFTNTTIGVVVTNARINKSECMVVAQGAHDGLARSITPPHTRADGDAFVAAATGHVEAHVDDLRLGAVLAVEQAVRAAVDTLNE